MSLLRSLEKKLNARILDLLIAGSSISTSKMSPEGKSFYEGIKKFFQSGLNQMSKDLQPDKKRTLWQKIFGTNK